jgi:GT2 family glycosyltransferase
VSLGCAGMMHPENKGVSYGWNVGLDFLFEDGITENILVLNNDAIIPSWFYRRLLNYDQPFITGVAVDVMPTEQVPHCPLTPNPDFSAFLIRRDAWERIGKFDERMKIYCSDCDYHIRGHRLGVPMLKANVPYYHVNSQTLKRADPDDREAIQTQANKDREVFKNIYNCLPGTEEYNQLFK